MNTARESQWVSPETVNRLKEIDLLTYLQHYDPQELVRSGDHAYRTRTHDSLVISNGMWHWFSRGIAHKSALDYLIHVKDMSFLDAVRHLANCEGSNKSEVATSFPIASRQTRQSESNMFALPEASVNNQLMLAYLMGRGIGRTILTHFIACGSLYEGIHRQDDRTFHNAVFVGFDKTGTARYASYRSLQDGKYRYRGDVLGSEKRFAFSMPAEKASMAFGYPKCLLSGAAPLKPHGAPRRAGVLYVYDERMVMICENEITKC